ncbi:putative quinol monooxygenase [Bradyrhizobium sp.]|uniref:putative quinol monooxygenase n=1 Tax=Bradyrhizobium sp. TaxID=376 RepID=UPI002CFD7B22|nr:putative quinol monooxygenase [Bradyrhizobium sp.]HWX58371.1 putative quinol monooxygenase [Bradyrhizobium sp.]
MADDFERLFGRDCRAHRRLDIRCVSYFQDIHANCLRRNRSELQRRPSNGDHLFREFSSHDMDAGHKGCECRKAPCHRAAARALIEGRSGRHPAPDMTIRSSSNLRREQFVYCRIIAVDRRRGERRLRQRRAEGATTMIQYAIDDKTVGEAVRGGGLLVVAQWEAKDGEADRVADILARFLPEAQREPGAALFLISRARDNPAQFLFYELFRDEAAFKAHQDSAHFATYIAGQALPLLAKRERMQYALL